MKMRYVIEFVTLLILLHVYLKTQTLNPHRHLGEYYFVDTNPSTLLYDDMLNCFEIEYHTRGFSSNFHVQWEEYTFDELPHHHHAPRDPLALLK